MDAFSELSTHIDAFVGRPLAKAEPPMSSRPHLRLEWVTDKNGHRSRRYHRTANKNVGERVGTADHVRDLASARDYWQRHFDGGEKSIKGVHGTKSFTIHVTFQGNHAYTDDALKLKDDGRRVFDPERARHMHYIWLVLSHPTHVGPSKLHPGKRQFDKAIDVESAKFGRVVLAPAPDADDLRKNRVTHWTFITWHMPSQGSFVEAGKTASMNPTKPDSPMRKAGDYSSALSLLLGHRREMSESDPGETGRLQGFPNALTPFDALTYRNHQVKQATDSRSSMAQQTNGIKPDYDSLTKSAVYRFPHEPTPAHTSTPDVAAILVVTPPSWCRGGMNP